MAQTSINIQPVKQGSEQHNKREKKLDYVREDLTYLNRYWQADSQAQRLQFIKDNYKKKTGQKIQAKATPIREAVVVIKSDTTMEQLQELGAKMKERWGVDCFQIAMHKDEGHSASKEWKPNLHAHMVFDWTNHESGKSIKLNRADMVELQTMTAQILGMDRGVSSDKKHLSAVQFKIEALEGQINDLEREIETLSITQQGKKTLKMAFERVKGVLGQSDKDNEIKRLREAENRLKRKIKESEEVFSKFKQDAKDAFKQVQIKYQSEIRTLNLKIDQAMESKRKSEKVINALCTMWQGEEDIKNVIREFKNDVRRNSFTLEEVARINLALGINNDTSTRLILANEIIKKMGTFAGCSIVERELKDIATKEWKQKQTIGLKR